MAERIFRPNFANMERELNEANLKADAIIAEKMANPAATIRSIALPEYVEHKEGTPDLGKITAEAVVRDYEAAAKNVEAIGEELKRLVARQQEILEELNKGIEEVNAVASRYREEGKRIFEELQSCSILTEDVRKTCAALQQKLVKGG